MFVRIPEEKDGPVYNESFYSSGHPPPLLPNCIQGTPFNLFPELPGDNSHEFSAKTNTDCDLPTADTSKK